MDDKRLKPAIDYLLAKRREDNTWKVDYRYKAQGYQVFDSGRESINWVTHIIKCALSNESLAT